jgi:hypothetical protein
MARNNSMGLPNPGNLRSPLEGVDLVADGINRLGALPGQFVGRVLDASGNAFNQVTSDLENPRQQPERPIPPDVLLKPIPQAVGHMVGGVIDVVKSGADAIVQNVDGARSELETFVRG